MAVEVRIHKYEASHGARPRGSGYWLFKIGDRTYQYTGLYSKAKQQAVKKARELDKAVIYLLP